MEKLTTVAVLVAGVVGGLLLVLAIMVIFKYCVKQTRIIKRIPSELKENKHIDRLYRRVVTTHTEPHISPPTRLTPPGRSRLPHDDVCEENEIDFAFAKYKQSLKDNGTRVSSVSSRRRVSFQLNDNAASNDDVYTEQRGADHDTVPSDGDAVDEDDVDEGDHETRVAVEVHRDSANGGAFGQRRQKRPYSVDVVTSQPARDRCLRRWHTNDQDRSPPRDATDQEVASIFTRTRRVSCSFDESEPEVGSASSRRHDSQDVSPSDHRDTSGEYMHDGRAVRDDRMWALREAYEEQDIQFERPDLDDDPSPAAIHRHVSGQSSVDDAHVVHAAVAAPAWRRSREFAFSFDSGETDESSRQGAPTTSFESSTDGTDGSGRGPKLQQMRDDSGYKSLETAPVSQTPRDYVAMSHASKPRSLDGPSFKTASRRRRDYRRERNSAGLETRGAPSDDTPAARRRVSRDYSIDEHTDAIFNEFMRYDPQLPELTTRTPLKHSSVVDRSGRCRLSDSKSRSMSIGYSGEPSVSAPHDKMPARMRRLTKQKTFSARDRQTSQDRQYVFYDKTGTYDERLRRNRAQSQDANCEYLLSQDRTDSLDRRLHSQLTHNTRKTMQ